MIEEDLERQALKDVDVGLAVPARVYRGRHQGYGGGSGWEEGEGEGRG